MEVYLWERSVLALGFPIPSDYLLWAGQNVKVKKNERVKS